MEDKELVEKVARAICFKDAGYNGDYIGSAKRVIRLVLTQAAEIGVNYAIKHKSAITYDPFTAGKIAATEEITTAINDLRKKI